MDESAVDGRTVVIDELNLDSSGTYTCDVLTEDDEIFELPSPNAIASVMMISLEAEEENNEQSEGHQAINSSMPLMANDGVENSTQRSGEIEEREFPSSLASREVESSVHSTPRATGNIENELMALHTESTRSRTVDYSTERAVPTESSDLSLSHANQVEESSMNSTNRVAENVTQDNVESVEISYFPSDVIRYVNQSNHKKEVIEVLTNSTSLVNNENNSTQNVENGWSYDHSTNSTLEEEVWGVTTNSTSEVNNDNNSPQVSVESDWSRASHSVDLTEEWLGIPPNLTNDNEQSDTRKDPFDRNEERRDEFNEVATTPPKPISFRERSDFYPMPHYDTDPYETVNRSYRPKTRLSRPMHTSSGANIPMSCVRFLLFCGSIIVYVLRI